jgi:hypothetical protein
VSAPQRIKRERTPGWRMPDGAIYVGRGRGCRWGNPIRWTSYPATAYDGEFRVPDEWRRRYAVADFEHDVLAYPAAYGYPGVDEIRRELAGRDLACWCPLGHPCHGDVLLRVANNPVDAPPPGGYRGWCEPTPEITYRCSGQDGCCGRSATVPRVPDGAGATDDKMRAQGWRIGHQDRVDGRDRVEICPACSGQDQGYWARRAEEQLAAVGLDPTGYVDAGLAGHLEAGPR